MYETEPPSKAFSDESWETEAMDAVLILDGDMYLVSKPAGEGDMIDTQRS